MTHTRGELTAALLAQLRTNENVTVYLRSVPANPPTFSTDDLRVLPYVVLSPSPGVPGLEVDQGDSSIDYDVTFYTNVVTGRSEDHDALLDYVTGLLERWSPFPEDTAVGVCRQINDPGPARKDTTVGPPPRFVTPLIWRLAVGN